MRTRRIIVVLAVIAISITSLFAGSANRQKIYRVDSSEYEDLKYLYIMTGHSLPSTTGPWSEDELSRMLAKIDRSSLTGSAAALYDNLDSVLNQERKELCEGFAIK